MLAALLSSPSTRPQRLNSDAFRSIAWSLSHEAERRWRPPFRMGHCSACWSHGVTARSLTRVWLWYNRYLSSVNIRQQGCEHRCSHWRLLGKGPTTSALVLCCRLRRFAGIPRLTKTQIPSLSTLSTRSNEEPQEIPSCSSVVHSDGTCRAIDESQHATCRHCLP